MISRALTLLPDERLAQLAAGGSDPAFAALYERYSPTLFAYCRSITRNADDGWDALQNAMIKVLVALRRTERTAPLRPWLFCIAHNEAIGVLRRRAAAERVAGAADARVAAGADEQAEIRERVSEVVSDVQQLPTAQRAALVMRELADLRYDEIAVALQTSEGNARQLVFAARAGLRDSRAGRGLPCDSVRDQLTLADGRLLRRRSVRAHLRTCDGCREYAVTVRRRSGRPARAAFGAWSPLGGYETLQSVFRAAADAGGAAAIQGGSSVLGPLALKAAAITAVVATGIGAADLATTQPGQSLSKAAAESAARAAAAPERGIATASSPRSGSARVAVVPAVAATASATTESVALSRPRASRKRAVRTRTVSGGGGSTRKTPRAPADARSGGGGRTAPADGRAPARARADCDDGAQRPQQHPRGAGDGAPASQPAPADSSRPPRDDPPVTRELTYTGDGTGGGRQHATGSRPVRADGGLTQAPAPEVR